MPPAVDLEALVCGGDGRIVCESTLQDSAGAEKKEEPNLARLFADEPAESFRVPVGEEIDWVDRNAAAVYDRDDSTKEITNPKSHQHHNNHNPNVKLGSNSQRYSANPKAPIIALPNKLRHSDYLGRSARRHSGNIRIFPKKANGVQQQGKSAVPESEPTSPKVSCIGRVLSDRDRNRRRKALDKGSSKVSREPSSVAPSSHVRSPRRRRAGFWSIFGFSCCVQGRRSAVIDEEKFSSSRTAGWATNLKTSSLTSSADTRVEDEVTSLPAPGLGGMKKFASGRRSAMWGSDLEQDQGSISRSGPLLATQQSARILERRSAATLADLDVDGNWKNSGPASI